MSKPYKYDVVGSFLRPDELKNARRQYENGEISKEDLRKVEDKCIKELVQNQKEAGLKAVTDGEFRRAYWHLDFLAALDGVKQVSAEEWSVKFKGAKPKANTLVITDNVDFPNDHPFVDHFKYLATLVDPSEIKVTIPSPTMLHLITNVREENYQPIDEYKNNEQKLYEDIAKSYKKAIQTFYDLGCRYLQFDDTSWGELSDPEKRESYEKRGFNLDKLAEDYVKLINKSIHNKPEDMTITMHICRGNFRSTWFSRGGYEPIAKELFGHAKIDGFFLEYDTERSGGFEPLRFIKDQVVVLGLITSKFPELENKAEVINRIKEASQYVSLKQLALSPQCGFASTEEGNDLTEKEQWNKVKHVKEIAEEVWEIK